jgi:sialate O-acetylesterase
MRLTSKADPARTVSLEGMWSYLPVAELRGGLFYKYGVSVDVYTSRPTPSVALTPHTATSLYNAMIAPLIPYRIQGAIWYQGESNVGRAEQYTRLFPQMIKSWRDAWGLGDFPFYFVQIAPWRYSGPQNTESADLREAQRLSMAVPHSGMVVTLDLGDLVSIHPGKKKEVGERLALWAMAEAYRQRDLVHSGPIFSEITVENGQAQLSFYHIGSGLVARGNKLNSFEIAGADGRFQTAQARIEGDQVVVSHPAVKEPVTVRYAYHNGSEASLFNAEGLPASSFTTVGLD